MKEERLWHLVSLKLAGEASPEELSELAALVADEPDVQFRISLIEEYWQSKHKAVVSDLDTSFNKHLQRLSNHFSSPALQYEQSVPTLVHETSIKKKFLTKRIVWVTSIAASFLIALSSIYLLTNRDNFGRIPQNIVTTKPGSKSKISLPDGSQVWLNSESKLTYNEKFGSSSREVELTGEAFFDVVKDKTKPFIIHTGTIDVKVVGTAFNVRSYPNEKTTETSLIRGLVEVTLTNNPDKKIILRPNEKLVVQNANIQIKDKQTSVATRNNEPLLILSNLHYMKGDSSAIETSWVKNKLAFDGESLEGVAGKIKRWYGVEVTIKDDRLKEGEYTGVFEDESLPEVMDALKLTGGFKYEINKKEVIIKP